MKMSKTEKTKFELRGIPTFRNSLLNKKTGHFVPEISRTNWNTKQLEVEDPFGNAYDR